eukprot:gb/GECG01002589.1/.p1 GENE.gb/GECG01002589.1/~~gb/GECG01002589.1/.p1  ORF type:complete len:469 (+),score=130.08 gb/GECG01002589.1/:1-1407(+)
MSSTIHEELFGVPEEEDQEEEAGHNAENDDDNRITQEDLFGTDVDDEDDEGATGPGQQSQTNLYTRHTDQSQEAAPKNLDAPRLCVPRVEKPVPGKHRLSSMRLPPTVSYAQQPYEAFLYDEETEELELHKKGKMAAAENMIRWRLKRDEEGNIVKDENGKPRMESNARAVKWSDGSYTLHIGRESFNFLQRAGETEHAHMFATQTAYNSTRPSEEEENVDGETCLEAVGPLASRFVLRPTRLIGSSSRAAVLEARRRTDRTGRGIAVTEYLQNPEKAKEKRVKELDEMWRMKQRQYESVRRGDQQKKGQRRKQTTLTADFLEAGDDYEEEEAEYEDVSGAGGLNELKRAVKSGERGGTKSKKKGHKEEEDDDDGFIAGEEDEDEEAEYEESEEGDDDEDEESSDEEEEDDEEDVDMEASAASAAQPSSSSTTRKKSKKKGKKRGKLKKRGEDEDNKEENESSDEDVK